MVHQKCQNILGPSCATFYKKALVFKHPACRIEVSCSPTSLSNIFFLKLCYHVSQKPVNLNGLDEDVLAERQRVISLMRDKPQKSDAFLVSDLRKEFGLRKKFVAVDNLTFGVKQGECFGFLGVNGAGKTTSFR